MAREYLRLGWRRGLRRCLRGTALLAAAMRPGVAQESPAAGEPHRASAGDAALTVHGTVVNAATGLPLARALVKTGTAKGTGAFTDEAGRFAIQGLTEGVLGLTVTKPGFRDPSDPDSVGAGMVYGNLGAHSVRVADGMPDLKFSLAPNNVLAGQVRLANGVPLPDVALVLYKKTVQSGQIAWQNMQRIETDLDGRFRVAGVSDGTFLLRTLPERGCNAKVPGTVAGFPPRFFPEAETMEGAEPIVLAQGQTVEADVTLTLMPLHLVQVKLPSGSAGEEQGYLVSVLDGAGRESGYLPFSKGDTLCAYLPDGSDTLVVSKFVDVPAVLPMDAARGASIKQVAGSLSFNVEGQPLQSLRLALAPVPSTPVSLHYVPGPPPHHETKAPTSNWERFDGSNPVIAIWAQRVADPGDTESARFQAFPAGDNTMELPAGPGGAYRIHAEANGGVCVGTVKSGGEDMARTPWVAAPLAAGPAVEAEVRTDCASLTLNMPVSLPAAMAGEGATLHIYLIPEFDSVADLPEAQLEQFGSRTATLSNLTPGAYRVFSFRAPQSIEYLNPRAVERLGVGQRVVLEPRGNAALTVEETPR